MPVHVGVGTKKEIGQKMENGVGEQAKGEQVTCSPYIDCLQLVLIGQGVTCNVPPGRKPSLILFLRQRTAPRLALPWRTVLCLTSIRQRTVPCLTLSYFKTNHPLDEEYITARYLCDLS